MACVRLSDKLMVTRFGIAGGHLAILVAVVDRSTGRHHPDRVGAPARRQGAGCGQQERQGLAADVLAHRRALQRWSSPTTGASRRARGHRRHVAGLRPRRAARLDALRRDLDRWRRDPGCDAQRDEPGPHRQAAGALTPRGVRRQFTTRVHAVLASRSGSATRSTVRPQRSRHAQKASTFHRR